MSKLLKGLFAQFATDPKLEKEGVWIEYPTDDTPEDQYPAFLVARAGGANTRYSKLMEAATKPFRRQLQAETMSRTKIEEITRDVFCKTVVLGCRNVTDVEGKPVTYSPENMVAYFKQLPELFADIESQATKATLYKVQMAEEAAGN